MKGVTNYLKNVTKSVAYAAADIGKEELMPNVGEFADNNKQFMAATYSALKNPKVTVRKSVSAIQNSKIYQALDYGVRNTFEDLKTGNFYNKERINRDELKLSGLDDGTDWDDLSEFGVDDDWESSLKDGSSKKEVTAGDMKIVGAIEGSNAAAANATVNAIIKTSEYQTKSSRANMAQLYMQNEKLFGGLHQDFSVMNATLSSIHKVTAAALQNIDKNSSDYYTQQLKLDTERNAILKEMLEMQRNQYMSAEEKEKKNAGRQTKKVRWSDINHGGIPDFDNYFDLVKKNIANELGNMGMPEFSENSNMLATFMTSPLKGAMKYVVNGLIPGTIKAATKELDSSLSGIFGNVIGALGNAREKDGPLGILARILGVNTSVNRTIDTSKYEKGPIPFDGITRKAVTDVIPAYLRRIEAYITGEPEQIYDYKAGKWIHLNTIKQRHDNIRKDAIRQGTSEIREAMSGGIRTAKTHTDPRTAMEIEDAFEEFFEYVYINNGRFNPKASADKNGIDMATYPNLYKHYKIVLSVFNEFDYSAISTRGGTKAYKRKYSTRMNMSKNVLEAKDNEERQYRALEQEMGPFLEFFSALKIDKHGKWKDNKFTSSDGLLKTKDDKGNTIFTYLQNINKELTWQREYGFDTLFGMGIHGGKPGSGSRGRRPKGSYSDYSDARRSRSREAFSRIDLESSEFKQERARQAAADDKRRKETENRVKRDLSKGKVDMSKFDDLEYAEYVLKLRELLAEGNSEEFKNEVKGYNENAIRKWIDKHLIKTDTKSIKDLREAAEKDGKSKYRSSKNGKDNKNIASRVLDNIHKVGSVTGGLIGASSEILTDIMYNANKAIYDMMYVAEVKDEKTGNRYDGFMNMIANKISDTFETGKSKFKEKIIDPVKKWLGIDENFEKRFKESLTGMGSGLFNTFIDSNKDVWGKVGKKILTEAGLMDGETMAQKHRKKNREKSMKDISEIESLTSILDPRFVKLMAEYDLNFVEYGEDFEAAKADLLKKAQQEFYKYTKKLKEVSNSDELRTGLSGLSEKEIKDFNTRYGLDESSGLDVLFSRIDTIKRTNPNYNPTNQKDKYGRSKENSYTRSQKSSDTRVRRNRVLSLAKSGNSSAAVKYAEEQGLTGTIEQKVEIIKRVAEENGKPLSKEHLSHLIIYNEDGSYDEEKTNANLAVNYLRLLRRNFAKGTISKPAIGPSILSKNELLFDSKGTHRVPKTGYYNLKEPTHILNSQDSHSLLSMMGVKGIGAKTTPGEDARKENYVDKKLFGKKFKHADGTIKVTNDGVSVDTKEIMSEAKKYVPEGLAGGLVGGILSMVLGIAGGPILGAAVGGATNIVRSSDTFKNMLFGEKGEDGKRTGKGLINSKIVNAVQKYAPDAIKFGMAGILPGLITPLGPIGGLLVGGAIGILKNNEKFKEKYFGKDGKLTIGSKEKNVIKKLLPGAAKGAGVGILSGFILGGPFGILGNAVIGSAIGMMTTTEGFKESIFGRTINGVKVGGLLNGVKEALSPLKGLGTDFAGRLKEAFDKAIINPLHEFMVPFIHQIPKMLGWLPRKIGSVIEDHFAKPMGTWFKNHVGKRLAKFFKPVVNVAGRVVSAAGKLSPTRLLGRAGKRLRAHQIERGEAEYMTAEERLTFMRDKRGRSKYTGSDFDEQLAGIGTKGGMSLEDARTMRDNFSTIIDTKSSVTAARRKQDKEIYQALTNAAGGRLPRKAIEKAVKAIENGHPEKVPEILKEYAVDGSKDGLKSDELKDLLSAKNDDGVSINEMLARRQNLASRESRIKNITNDDKNKAAKALAADLEKLGIKVTKKDGTIDMHKLRQYYKYLDTEIVNREANPEDVEKQREIRDEENTKTFKDIATNLSLITRYLTGTSVGEYDAKIKIKNEDGTESSVNKASYDIDRASKTAVDELHEREVLRADEILREKGIDTDTVSDETKQTLGRNASFRTGKRIRSKRKGKIAKAANSENITEKDIKKSTDQLDKIKKLKDTGININEDDYDNVLKYFESLRGSYKFNTVIKRLKNRYLNKFCKGSSLTSEDICTIADLYNEDVLILNNRCKLLTQNNKYYSDFGSIKTIIDKDFDINAYDYNESAKDKTSQTIHSAFNKVGKGLDKIHVTGHSRRKQEKRAKTYNEYLDNEPEDIESKPEHHLLGTLLGIGKDILGGLFNIGTDIAGGLFNAGKNGVKKLASKGKNAIISNADRALSKAKDTGKGLLGHSSGNNLDEVDKPNDGKDVAQLAPGKFGLIKRDSSGNIEPDTSDSRTKQILDELKKDSESNKKAQEAQIESAKQIKNAFDVSDMKESQGGKFKWWQLLFGAGLLASSGLLDPIVKNVLKPLWDKILVPAWDNILKPAFKKVFELLAETVWNFVSDADGDGKSDGIFGIIRNMFGIVGDICEWLTGKNKYEEGNQGGKEKSIAHNAAETAKNIKDGDITGAFNGAFKTIGSTTDVISNGKTNAGTTTVTSTKVEGLTLYDKDGKAVKNKDIEDGKVKDIYNAEGTKGEIYKDNNGKTYISFEDPSIPGEATVYKFANAAWHQAARGANGISYKMANGLYKWSKSPTQVSKLFNWVNTPSKGFGKTVKNAGKKVIGKVVNPVEKVKNKVKNVTKKVVKPFAGFVKKSGDVGQGFYDGVSRGVDNYTAKKAGKSGTKFTAETKTFVEDVFEDFEKYGPTTSWKDAFKNNMKESSKSAGKKGVGKVIGKIKDIKNSPKRIFNAAKNATKQKINERIISPISKKAKNTKAKINAKTKNKIADATESFLNKFDRSKLIPDPSEEFIGKNINLFSKSSRTGTVEKYKDFNLFDPTTWGATKEEKIISEDTVRKNMKNSYNEAVDEAIKQQAIKNSGKTNLYRMLEDESTIERLGGRDKVNKIIADADKSLKPEIDKIKKKVTIDEKYSKSALEKVGIKSTDIENKALQLHKEKTAKEFIDKSSNKSFIAGAKEKLKDFLENFFKDSTVFSKFKQCADYVKSSKPVVWIEKLKSKIDDLLKKAFDKVASKVSTTILIKGLKYLNWIITGIFVISDFIWGFDHAGELLKVKNPTIIERVICALVNTICNYFILLTFIPGLPEFITQSICGFISPDLKDRQDATEAEWKDYALRTGSTLSEEEYIDKGYTFSGSVVNLITTGNSELKGINKNFKYVKATQKDKHVYTDDEFNTSDNENTLYNKYYNKTKNVFNPDALSNPFLDPFGINNTKDKNKKKNKKELKKNLQNPEWLKKNEPDLYKQYINILHNDPKADTYKTIDDVDKNSDILVIGNYIDDTGLNLIRITNTFNYERKKGLIVYNKSLNAFTDQVLIKNGKISEHSVLANLMHYYYKLSLAKSEDCGNKALSKIKKIENHLGYKCFEFALNNPSVTNNLPNLSIFKTNNKNNKKKKAGRGNLQNKVRSKFGKAKINGNKEINSILDSFNKSTNKLSENIIDNKTEDDGVTKAREGKTNIFDKKYWTFSDKIESDNSFSGLFTKAKFNIQKVLNAPIMLATYGISTLAANMSSMGAFLELKYNEIKDSLPTITKTSSGEIEVKASNSSQNKSSSSSSVKAKTTNNKSSSNGNFITNTINAIGNSVIGKAFKAVFGKGTSYVKQTDPSIAGIQFNSSSDSEYQTIGDSGCGPAAAVNAVRSAYGRGSEDLVSAADYALSNGYKETNGGTMPGFFSDYFSKNGLSSQTSYNKSTIANNIKNGNPTVLMGSDSNGVSANTPYGYNPHYVTATGLDSNGHVIIQDPESEYDNQAYSLNDVMNKTSFGVSAFGRNGNKPMARFGGSKYGRGDESKIWWYLTQKDKFGLTEAGAAGIMGNMEAESGMKANNLEGIYESSLGYNDETYTKAVDDGTYKNFTSDRAGYGLIQFTDKGRWKEPYYNYVKKGKKKRSIGSLSAQLEFLNKDIKKNDKSLYKVLSTTDSTKDATVKWLTDVERCKGYNTSSVQNYRTSLSNKWYKKFTGKEGTPIDTEDVSSDSSSSSKSEEKKESSWIEKVTNVLNKSKAGRVLDKIFGLSSGETTTPSSSSDSNNGSSSKTGEAMVEVAKKEVGNTDYTKYNGHAGAWCADFVSWVAKQVGLSSKVFPPYAGCTSGYQPLINAGAKEVKLKDGRAGDIIFYSTDGNKNRYHTGILAEVNKNNTISYEGNWSDKVAKVDYQRSKKEWEMYLLRPAYPDVEEDKIMKKTMSKDKIGKKYQYTLTEDAVMYTPTYQPLDEKLPKGTKVVMHRIGKNEGTYAIDYWIDTNGKKHTKKYKGYILTSMQGSVKDRKAVKGKKSGKGTSINLPISDRTINNEAKPMAKFGMHKNSLYGKGTIKYPPRKISTMDAHGNRGTVAISSEDQEAAKLIKSYSRKNVYTNWGLGTNEPTRNNINVQQNYGGGKTTYIFDNTILLNTIVKILYTIADNTDKLNTIVSILNNKLGSSITADDIANASTSDTLKSKLQQSLKNIAGSNSQSYNDSTSNDSINNIIMAMNSIASE